MRLPFARRNFKALGFEFLTDVWIARFSCPTRRPCFDVRVFAWQLRCNIGLQASTQSGVLMGYAPNLADGIDDDIAYLVNEQRL
jgi:hypothetical protein